MAGPLEGVRVIEMAGIGPGPFCCMMLADMGADVIRVEQKGGNAKGSIKMAEAGRRFDLLARGRRSLAVDLKKPGGCEAVLTLIEKADALVEGFRPGVMERLGLGPDVCLARQPRLVFGRMTGWGQTGTLAHAAGHDINYLSLSGALHAIGPADAPVPPLNLVADFGGGAMMLAFGVACALFEARGSGKGQVVDAAMTDGAALLSTGVYGLHASGFWTNKRQDNLLDGGAHYYGNYSCADGKFISIGPLEPQFYALLLKLCELDASDFEPQMDRARWPERRAKLEALFKTKTRDEWCQLLEGTDACVAGILDWDEAPQHPHNRARNTFVEIDGITQPAPAPRFSRTPGKIRSGPAQRGEHTDRILGEWGFNAEAIAELRQAGAI